MAARSRAEPGKERAGTPTSIPDPGGLHRELGVGRKLPEQVGGAVKFAPAGDGDLAELEVPHPVGDGGQLSLHGGELPGGRQNVVRRNGPHSRHPARG